MKRTPLKRKTPLRLSKLKPRSFSQLKRTKLKQRSKKKQKQDSEYSRLRKQFLHDHPWCKVCEDEFTGTGSRSANVKRAAQVHHMARRGKHYLNTVTWLPVCAHHHHEIESHGDWARAHGYLLTPEQRRLLG